MPGWWETFSSAPDVQPRTTIRHLRRCFFPETIAGSPNKKRAHAYMFSHGGGYSSANGNAQRTTGKPQVSVASGGGGVSRVVLRGRGRRPSPSRCNFADFNRVAPFPVLRSALGPPADECRTTAAAINKRHPTAIVYVYSGRGGLLQNIHGLSSEYFYFVPFRQVEPD